MQKKKEELTDAEISKMSEEKKQSLLQSFMVDEYKPILTATFLFGGITLMMVALIAYYKYYKPVAFVATGIFGLLTLLFFIRLIVLAFMNNNKRIKHELEWKENQSVTEARESGKSSVLRNKVAFESIERLNHLTEEERKKYKRKYITKSIFPRISYFVSFFSVLIIIVIFSIVNDNFTESTVTIIIIFSIISFGFALSLLRVLRVGEDERIIKYLKTECWAIAAMFVKNESPFGDDISFADLRSYKLNTTKSLITYENDRSFAFYKNKFSKKYSYDDINGYDVLIDGRSAEESDLEGRNDVSNLQLVIYLNAEGTDMENVTYIKETSVHKDSRYYTDCMHYIDESVKILEHIMTVSYEDSVKKNSK